MSNRPPDHVGDASDVTVADGPADTPAGAPADTPAGGHLAEALVQLGAYVEGLRQAFDLALDLRTASPFDRRVWWAAQQVPFGATATYGELAAAIGAPGAARAVGGALGRNPVLIVVPCHRILRAGGGLGGFAAGLPLKQALLAHESSGTAPRLF